MASKLVFSFPGSGPLRPFTRVARRPPPHPKPNQLPIGYLVTRSNHVPKRPEKPYSVATSRKSLPPTPKHLRLQPVREGDRTLHPNSVPLDLLLFRSSRKK